MAILIGFQRWRQRHPCPTCQQGYHCLLPHQGNKGTSNIGFWSFAQHHWERFCSPWCREHQIRSFLATSCFNSTMKIILDPQKAGVMHITWPFHCRLASPSHNGGRAANTWRILLLPSPDPYSSKIGDTTAEKSKMFCLKTTVSGEIARCITNYFLSFCLFVFGLVWFDFSLFVCFVLFSCRLVVIHPRDLKINQELINEQALVLQL